MNLRRISSVIGLPDSERLRRPRPNGSGAHSKTLLLSRRQLNIQPIRLTPKPDTSTKGTDKSNAAPTIRLSKVSDDHAITGPSRQLILSTPAPESDILDGISELPPSAMCFRSRVLRSDTKKKVVLSQTTSRVHSGFKSKIPSSKTSREKFMAKRRLSVSKNTHKNITAPHARIQAVDQLSVPASPLSGNSTDQFEADELAAAVPTPAPIRQKSMKTCQSNCLEAVEEMRNLQQELIVSYKKFMDKQTARFEKQNKLIEKQTEVLCKLSSLLGKNIEVLNSRVANGDRSSDVKENRRIRSKRHNIINNHSDSSEDDLSDAEKENGKDKHKARRIGHEAESQYNDIRSEFGFLRLKTPGKDRDGGPMVSPKTPKSILSRTLQMQLGDIFEEN